MIRGNYIARTLEDQVRENTSDISEILHNTVLAGLGPAKLVATYEDLPAVDSEEFEDLNYGTVYAVGDASEYDYYCKVYDDTTSEDKWFGPMDIKGEEGADGKRGSVWVSSSVQPSTALYNPGDIWLDTTTYDIYELKLLGILVKAWVNVGNIKGAAGVVQSVNGKSVANVTLTANDIRANNSATIQSNLERIDGEIERVEDEALKLAGGTMTGAINFTSSGSGNFKNVLTVNDSWRIQASTDTTVIKATSLVQTYAGDKLVTINGVNGKIYPNDPEMTIGTPYDKFGSLYLLHDVNCSHVYTNGVSVTDQNAGDSDPSSYMWNSVVGVANTNQGVKITKDGIAFDITDGGSFLSAPWEDAEDMEYSWVLPSKSGTLATTSDIPSISGTSSGSNWTTITINGTTKNIPAGGGAQKTLEQLFGEDMQAQGLDTGEIYMVSISYNGPNDVTINYSK